MMETISIINQKGGVGKSTTAHALGQGLILKGRRTLYVDLDPQGALSYTMGADTAGITAMDILTRKATAAEAIQRTAQGDIIPAGQDLAGADMLITQTGKEYRLKEALGPVKEMYEYIVIDTPPALGILTVNALTASTGAVIPAQADAYSLRSVGQLFTTIETIRQYTNPGLTVKGILLTRHSPRSILSRDMAEMIEQTARQLGTKVYSASIRECIAVKEAQAVNTDIYSYSPRSNASADYSKFVSEFLRDPK